MDVPGFKKVARNRQTARDEVREDVFKRYLARSGDVLPKQQCEVEKVHGVVHWWLEPLLEGENELVVEEEKLDGQWTLRIEPLVQKIRVFT